MHGRRRRGSFYACAIVVRCVVYAEVKFVRFPKSVPGVAGINATKIQPGACVFSFCECGMCKIGRLRNPTPESNVQVVRTSRRNQPSNIGPGGWGNNHKNN